MKRAFTLIEVMVVLSVLAIIAILAYNFFGSTMKEARISAAITKIRNDLRMFEEAYELYGVDNGGALPPAGKYSLQLGTLEGSWISDYLKAIPTPPDSELFSSCSYSEPGDYYYAVDLWNDPGSPTTAKESYAVYACPSIEVCEAFNDKYTSLGPNVWDYTGNGNDLYGSGETIFCYANIPANWYAIAAYHFR